jgi:hypothetical protein
VSSYSLISFNTNENFVRMIWLGGIQVNKKKILILSLSFLLSIHLGHTQDQEQSKKSVKWTALALSILAFGQHVYGTPALPTFCTPTTELDLPFRHVTRLGSEFTFYHPTFDNQQYDLRGNIVANEGTKKGMIKLSQAMLKKCGHQCSLDKVTNRYGVSNYNITHTPSGIWFNVATDPSTLETQMKPLTLAQYEDNEDIIQHLLFDTASELDYHPDTTLDDKKVLKPQSQIPFFGGGGHIHMGVMETFHNNPLMFRNFLVYLQNHPYLFQWGFGNYPNQAPTLAIQMEKMRNNFDNIIKDFDKNPAHYTILKLANRLNNEVFSTTIDSRHGPAQKYQAFSLQRISSKLPPSDWTVEFRVFGPQRNIHEFIKQSTFINAIIKKVQGIKTPIPYQKIVIDAERDYHGDYNDYYYTSLERKKMILQDFYQTASDIGLDGDEYSSILNRYIQNGIDHGYLTE